MNDWLRLTSIVGALLFLLAPKSDAAETIPPVTERFAGASKEVPDFQRHVLPLFGRLGCNGRECHGSFQGQGGFRLSLFGYDFAADHASLLEADHQRVDVDDPAASLVLQKPSLAVEHKGGRRFAVDSWEYQLLRRWIAAGAPSVPEDHPSFVALEVEPREIVFEKLNDTVRLKAFATWSDGTREEVTPLCRFRSNNESLATIDAEGIVTAVGPGDTHVVAFYDNGIAAIPVILPVSKSHGKAYPEFASPTKIDELVAAKLRKVGIVPSDVCTDTEFLRRVSLDMTGTLPTPSEVEAFLADSATDKRQRKVDELLERPAYAAWWTTQFGDWLGNSEANLPIGGEQGVRREKSAQWYDWLYRRIEKNVPYDEIAAGIVLATSRRPGQTVDDFNAEMSSYFRSEDRADFAERETMPYFWTRGRFSPPQPLRFSYAFLGLRLECAQCHKHPYDQWTKDDYEGFQAFFDSVGVSYGDRKAAEAMKQELGLTADQDSGGYKKLFADLASSGKVVPWQEVTPSSLQSRLKKAQHTAKKTGGRVFTPKLLGGEEVMGESDDARAPLMQWLREADNPYFAKTLVNRVWANYFGIGIVDPPDDMNLANPPSNGPLLDYLASEFVARRYDLKWLHREIAMSHAYQRSWRPNATNEGDERNFSRAIVRRLPAEVLVDAVEHATASEQVLATFHNDAQATRARAIGVSSGFGKSDSTYAANLFGKPNREGICDCQRSSEPSLLQTIYFRNDAELLGKLDRKGGWLRELSSTETSDDDLIRAAYLRTFSRHPTEAETAVAREHLAGAGDRARGLGDLLWALVNSKEFLLNH